MNTAHRHHHAYNNIAHKITYRTHGTVTNVECLGCFLSNDFIALRMGMIHHARNHAIATKINN